jgi:hypothetical protein
MLAAGYQSISDLAAARRAARIQKEKENRQPAVEPLMRESWSKRGGVQSLTWHDEALQTDDDGARD